MEAKLMQLNQANESRPLSWLTYERRNWLAIVLLALMGGYAGGNGHTTQGAVQNISQQLGTQGQILAKVKQHDACEHRRADVSSRVAVQAIVGANSPVGLVPDVSALPADCPHPVAPKK